MEIIIPQRLVIPSVTFNLLSSLWDDLCDRAWLQPACVSGETVLQHGTISLNKNAYQKVRSDAETQTGLVVAAAVAPSCSIISSSTYTFIISPTSFISVIFIISTTSTTCTSTTTLQV